MSIYAIITLSIFQLYKTSAGQYIFRKVLVGNIKQWPFQIRIYSIKIHSLQNWMTKHNVCSLESKPKIILFQNWVSRNCKITILGHQLNVRPLRCSLSYYCLYKEKSYYKLLKYPTQPHSFLNLPLTRGIFLKFHYFNSETKPQKT